MPALTTTMENGAGTLTNGVANGATGDENSPFDRREYLRLVLQSLDELGFGTVRQALENESGVVLQGAEIEAFQRGVLQGDWKLVDERIADLQIHSDDDLKSARFLIYQQKFLELLEDQKMKEALDCLRHELTPNSRDSSRLHRLSSMIMCTSSEDLRRKAGWPEGDPVKARAKARAHVLSGLRAFVSPTVLLPEHRMQTLLRQSLQWQQQHCPYHNAVGTKYSLFSDHACTRSEIPSELKLVLEKHSDEVWYVRFSHNGLYLASGSKDYTVVIWDVLDPRMRPLRTLVGHTGAVSLVAWSPDDSMLLTCSSDNTFRLWDSATGQCKRVITSKHSDSPTAVAWMPDGQRFVTGGIDKHVYMMDLSGNELQQWSGPRVNDIVVSTDGRLMIVICQVRLLFAKLGYEQVSAPFQNMTSLCQIPELYYYHVTLPRVRCQWRSRMTQLVPA
eukprot:TRINITY_DN7370_c0_g1_i2.p1 TRINITY_DN7370_c0_g1~~TRINITY_DN7370_c0_g1_i2.p1  ORF type:complete len:447 (-),score=136.27 TRINITY_DN7370_c0_g1_i2:125-1465(-)